MIFLMKGIFNCALSTRRIAGENPFCIEYSTFTSDIKEPKISFAPMNRFPL